MKSVASEILACISRDFLSASLICGVKPSISPNAPFVISSATASSFPLCMRFAIMLASSSRVPLPFMRTSICFLGRSLIRLTASCNRLVSNAPNCSLILYAICSISENEVTPDNPAFLNASDKPDACSLVKFISSLNNCMSMPSNSPEATLLNSANFWLIRACSTKNFDALSDNSTISLASNVTAPTIAIVPTTLPSNAFPINGIPVNCFLIYSSEVSVSLSNPSLTLDICSSYSLKLFMLSKTIFDTSPAYCIISSMLYVPVDVERLVSPACFALNMASRSVPYCACNLDDISALACLDWLAAETPAPIFL